MAGAAGATKYVCTHLIFPSSCFNVENEWNLFGNWNTEILHKLGIMLY